MSDRPDHWLMKSEPEAFSIDALKAAGAEPWEGVRNYQARNFMRDDMRPGDPVLFYHSSCAEPGVYGLAEVASDPRPDPTQFKQGGDYFDPKATRALPRWFLVDVKYVRHLEPPVLLHQLRAQASRLGGFRLIEGSRLSVMPVDIGHFDFIVSLGRR